MIILEAKTLDGVTIEFELEELFGEVSFELLAIKNGKIPAR